MPSKLVRPQAWRELAGCSTRDAASPSGELCRVRADEVVEMSDCANRAISIPSAVASYV